MSEGAGALVLESLDHALERKAPIFAEVLGYGSSADAFRITDIHPKGDGAAFAMQGPWRTPALPRPISTTLMLMALRLSRMTR